MVAHRDLMLPFDLCRQQSQMYIIYTCMCTGKTATDKIKPINILEVFDSFSNISKDKYEYFKIFGELLLGLHPLLWEGALIPER